MIEMPYSDKNRGVSGISYNVLNLPCRIAFNNNRSIETLYRADGVKLSSEMIMDNLPDEMAIKTLVPGVVAEASSAGDDAAVISKESKLLTANIIDTKTYIGNYEFSGDSLTRFNTPYGYFLHGHFYVIDYDYQGNHKESGGNYACGVAQDNNYYPYGLPIRGGGNTQYTPYLFGNKEFEDRQGLNIYDFGARTYIPDECRFWQPDPKAHDYHWLSPYAYCGGDPINRIDPDGCDFWYTNDVSEILTFYNSILAGASTYDFSNWQHTPDIEFLNHVVYDDRTFKLYATTTSVIDGSFTVTCTIHTFPIYPVVNYYNKQVYEPVKGILDEISYFFNPWTYNDGVSTWSVGKNGRINGLASIIGLPPLAGKGKIFKAGKWLEGGTEKMGKAIGKMSRNRVVQREQIDHLVMKYHLSNKQRDILHKEISHEGLGYHEIEEFIIEYFLK